MAAGTLAPTQPKAPASLEATAPNRIDEHDADYVRLHSGTVARLQSSLRRYVCDLRAAGHDAHRQMAAAQAFIQHHTALLRDAYAAGWREGHKDYYSGASASSGIPTGVTVQPPTSEQQGKRLRFYAPSVAKMAAEGLRALQAEHVAQQSKKLSESIILAAPPPATDGLGAWADGLQQRVALQAEIVWPALQDGYSTAGGSDAARPFSQLWWQLQPVKTDHCADCPWVAYNSPYDPPGSGGNELAQTPGDGRTECGAACHCTLSYGGFELPQDADWAQYMIPPDAPFATAPANPGRIPAAIRQQGQNHYRPGRMPMGVSREGDYVYAGTPQEQDLAAQRGQSLYGTISEPRPGDESFTVAPIAAGTQALSTGQLQALDAFRSAWSRWNAVRGARPAARSLFGYVYDEQRGTFARPSATAGLLVPQRNPAGFAQRAGPNGERFANSWDELSPRQQAALVDLYRAIAAWDSATKDAGSGAGQQQLSEDEGDSIALTGGHERGYGDQPGQQFHTTHGHWGPGQGEEAGSGGGGGGHEQMQHEAAQAMRVNRGIKGSGGGANLAPHQRAQKEQELAHFTAQRDRIEAAVPKMDAWLSSHTEDEPGYAKISDQRLQAAQAHEQLQGLIENRQTLLGQAVTARHDLAPMPTFGARVTQPKANRSQMTAEQLAAFNREQVRQRVALYRARHKMPAPLPPAKDTSKMTPEERDAYRKQRAAEVKRHSRATAKAMQRRNTDLSKMTPEERDAHLRRLNRERVARSTAKKAATEAKKTKKLMEMGDELLRDCAALLAASGEDRVLSITLTGGHDPGYEQPRQAGGKWGPTGNTGHSGTGESKQQGNGEQQEPKAARGTGSGGGGAQRRAPKQNAQQEKAAKVRETARAKGKADAEGVQPEAKAPARRVAAKATETRTPEEKLVAAHQAKIAKAQTAYEAARDAYGEHMRRMASGDNSYGALEAMRLGRIKDQAQRTLDRLKAKDPLAPKPARIPRQTKSPEERASAAQAKADRAEAQRAKNAADAQAAHDRMASRLEPVGHLKNESVIDPYGPPNAHALRTLYGDHQLEAALSRHSARDLAGTARALGIADTGARAALVKRIAAQVRQVSPEMSQRIADGEADAPKGMAKKAAAEAKKTKKLMEMGDELLRDCAALLAASGEDRVESITLTGGHEPGYQQDRDGKGRWAPTGNEGGEHNSGARDNGGKDSSKQESHASGHARASSGSGEAAHVTYFDREARRSVHQAFGRDLSEHEVSALVGARTGDKILVRAYGKGNFALTVEGANGSYQAEREVRKLDNGMIVIHNDNIHVVTQGRGLGAEILARQVSGASRLGVSRIDTTAARSGSMNGYDTWAKLGYDGHLPGGIRTDFGDQLRAAGVQRGTVQELMRVTEPVIKLPSGRMVNGQELWKIRGDTWSGTFDVTPGSKNRQVLRAYLEAKGRKSLADELQLKAPADSTDAPQGEEIDWTSEDDAISLDVWRELDAKWKREEAATRGHQEALDD